MSQFDWISDPAPKPFKDIRNTRASSAEEKAVALLELCKVINKAPPKLAAGGSINQIREWKVDKAAAAKIAASKRASTSEIHGAINRMLKWWRE
jgi:ethanolamine ammonia-lyase large subunit